MEPSLPPVVDPCEQGAWQRLKELSEATGKISLRNLLEQPRDSLRFEACGLHIDFSRQRVDDSVIDSLLALAQETFVPERLASLRSGQHINTTEDRAVLHTALRMPADSSLMVDGSDAVTGVHEVLTAMAAFARGIRDASIVGSTGRPFTDIVNIGIGGSDLGPAMATAALSAFGDPDLRVHYVSNLDPADLAHAISRLDPETTLVIVVSKTFTTAETMANADGARRWIASALGTDAVGQHFAAVSTNLARVSEFGIPKDRIFGFWDWVGGRYSLTSAVGLSTMIAIGPKNFSELLRGFHEMDEHLAHSPERMNVPLLMGLIAIWNRNFLNIQTTAVLPYCQNLARFPAYLQQLTMESNGKSVRLDGEHVTYDTGAIYWGEPGTNGQHSFYQLLHQGTSTTAIDIVIVVNQPGLEASQQLSLVAHGLAQASVFSLGRTKEEWRHENTPEELLAHKEMKGNRPTTVITLSEVTPFALGALISLYEGSVFIQGAVWGINSFDQWGVELGKKVATDIESVLNDSRPGHFDSATNASISLVESLRKSP